MTKLKLLIGGRSVRCFLAVSGLLLLPNNSSTRAASPPTRFFEEAKLFPPVGHPLNGVGRAVDIKGNRAIVGAIGSGSGSGPFDAAFIFERVGNGWKYVEELIPSTVQAVTSTFGISVAINGGTALVGADLDGRVAVILVGWFPVPRHSNVILPSIAKVLLELHR
jgi:hypothetical protein